MEGMKAFGYFGLFKVTRCKSGTHISHDRGNGYVRQQTKQRLTISHRWQVESSHRSSHRVSGHPPLTHQHNAPPVGAGKQRDPPSICHLFPFANFSRLHSFYRDDVPLYLCLLIPDAQK